MLRKNLENKLKLYLHNEFLNCRQQNNFTQADMAKLLRMDTRSYIDLDHGKSLCGTLTFALYIATVLQTDNEKLRLCNDLTDVLDITSYELFPRNIKSIK